MMPFPKPILKVLGFLTLMLGMAFTEVKEQNLLESFESMTTFPFQRDGDRDGFPDEWYLNEGQSYQAYHTVTLDQKTGMGDSSSLRFDFSGGKAGVFSVPLKLSNRYAYNIRFAKKGKGLSSDFEHRLRFGLRMYDSKHQLLDESHFIDETEFPEDWTWSQTLRIPSLPKPTASCVLYIDLSGRPAGDSQLWVDQIEIQLSPSITYNAEAVLSTFRPEQAPTFKVEVGGTQKGKTYKLHHTVHRFNGDLIFEEKKQIEGSDQLHVEEVVLKDSGSGVFYLDAKLELDDQVIVSESQIIARDSVELAKGSSRDIGVLLGHPEPPFGPLLQSLELLGTAISKLDLMDDDFHLGNYSDDEGLPKLNSLLRKHAPDKGVRFIARAHGVPQDHQEDGPRGPKHIAETFHHEIWKDTFKSWLRQYGNVLSDWQLGEDHVDLTEKHLSNLEGLVGHLKSEADWMNILLPGLEAGNEMGVPNLMVPSSLPHDKVEALLRSHNSSDLHVTLEMKDHDHEQIEIIEDLVIKMAKVESLLDREGKPLVTMTFIDRLAGEDRGLMTRDYEPHSSYFAAKTMIHWLGGAEPLGTGRFTHPDSDIDSRVFGRGDQAFAIVWRKDSSKARVATPTPFYLGRGLEIMDLMGNRTRVPGDPKTGMMVPVGRTPVILITPHRKLWETILSFQLVEKNGVRARVKFQPQGISFINHFPQQAKFNLNWVYPSNWEVEPVALEPQIASSAKGQVDFNQSPSPLYPMNKKVPVHVDVDISMEGDQHFAKVYREDRINSDLKPTVHFYPDGNDLKIELQIKLSEAAPKRSSFVASAQLPDGRILEAFYKDLAPGTERMASLFVAGGKSLIGGDLTLTVRESIGERYLLTSHPIKTRF